MTDSIIVIRLRPVLEGVHLRHPITWRQPISPALVLRWWPLVPQSVVEPAQHPSVLLGGETTLGKGDDVVDLAGIGR